MIKHVSYVWCLEKYMQYVKQQLKAISGAIWLTLSHVASMHGFIQKGGLAKEASHSVLSRLEFLGLFYHKDKEFHPKKDRYILQPKCSSSQSGLWPNLKHKEL